jgi:hypothetical protein
MKATYRYEPPRIERHETLRLPLIGNAIISGGGLPSSAAFRSTRYDPPRIESRELIEGALIILLSGVA